MLRSQAITRIQRGLSFRSDLLDVIIDALQEAQRDLEGAITLPWFLIAEDVSVAVTAGSQSVALPTGFIRFVEDEQLHYIDTKLNSVFLTKTPFDEATTYFNGTTAGAPTAYTLRSASISVWPVPDIAYTLKCSYYKRGTLLDSNITNAWLTYCPELLIALAGLLVAVDLENETSTKKFGAMYTKWAAWLVQEIAAREEQGNPRAIGRNH